MANSKIEAEIEERFINELKHHLSGWHKKILNDFSEDGFNKELSLLQSDPLYSKFGFSVPEYALVRLMGRFSISIGRRLGEIYDKVIRFATSKRFNLKLEEVSPIFEDLQLDIRISFESLSNEDKQHLVSIFHTNFPNSKLRNGLGIEIRYNFNPNDSSRLKKDVKMGSLLQDAGLFPIYLIFSVISPRKDAIARLKRAGWNFLVGKAADDFMYNLVDMDFAKILDGPKIQSEIRQEIDMLMKEMLNSIAFKRGAKIE